MSNRLGCALQTYTQPRILRIAGGLNALMTTGLACHWWRSWDTWPVLPLFGLAAWCGILMGMHLRAQFEHARARLTPGFAMPHLIAAVLIAALVLLAPSIAASVAYAKPIAVIVALDLLLFTTMMSSVAANNYVAAAIGMAVWLLLFGQFPFVTTPMRMDDSRLSAWFIAGSLLTWLWTGWKLTRWNDAKAMGNPFPKTWTDSEANSIRALEDAAEKHWPARLQMYIIDRRMDRLSRKHGDGFWSQVRRRRLAWYQPMNIVLIVLGLTLLFQRNSMSFGFLFMLTGMSMMFAWRKRRAMQSMELLRPIWREAFVRQTIATIGLDFLAANIPVLVLAGIAAMLSPTPTHRIGHFAPTPWLWIIPAAMVLYGSASLWMLTCRSNVEWWIGMMASVYVVMLGAVLPQVLRPDYAFIPPVVGITLLVSVLLTISAYRRWMAMEFG